MTWLGEGQQHSTHEVSSDVATCVLIADVIKAISEHLRGHIEELYAVDGICVHQSCHTNMYTLTAEVGFRVYPVGTVTNNKQQQDQHDSIHRDNSKIKEERDQLLAQVRDFEDMGTERDRLQQQVNHLQEAANERDPLMESLKEITEERNSLQDQNSQLTRQLDAGSGIDDRMRTKESEPETQVAENPTGPRESEAPSKLQYCNVCLKSVDKISANVRLYPIYSRVFLISATGQI